MTLAEVMASRPKVSRSEALQAVKWHGANVVEFFAECGDLQEYDGATVLEWLGY